MNKIVIGVKFKELGKIYYFDPKGEKFEKGDFVIVETSLGEQYTEVVIPNKEVKETSLAAPLKPIIRKANFKDKKHHDENKKKEADAFKTAEKEIYKKIVGNGGFNAYLGTNDMREVEKLLRAGANIDLVVQGTELPREEVEAIAKRLGKLIA